jgi:hypothetical protein
LQNQSEGYDFTVYVPRGSLSTYKRTKVWSTLPLSEWDIPSDVERVEAENNTEVTYYGVDGTRLSAPKTGINILRSSDRKAKKAFFK